MPWMDNNGCSLNATEMIWKGKMFSEDRGPPSVQDELVSQSETFRKFKTPPQTVLWKFVAQNHVQWWGGGFK